MIILAIDPGTIQSAFVVMEVEDNFDTKRLIGKGIIQNGSFKYLFQDGRYMGAKIDIVSIEMIASYGMPVGREVFETVYFIGRLAEYFLKTTPVTRVYRKDIKLHLCGSVKAKDGNIRQALIDKYGNPGTKKAPNSFYNDGKEKMAKDIWAALAVADYTFSALNDVPLVFDK